MSETGAETAVRSVCDAFLHRGNVRDPCLVNVLSSSYLNYLSYIVDVCSDRIV